MFGGKYGIQKIVNVRKEGKVEQNSGNLSLGVGWVRESGER